MTVAEAAQALSRAGDRIDASNVSRYLARFRDLPQEKIGKFRFVDLNALARHRQTNVLVGEKQAARDMPEPQLVLQPRPSARVSRVDDDEADEIAPASSELNQANVHLKRLKIREAELDLAEREGHLVPDSEVMVLVSGVLQTLVSELERGETALASSHGREVAAAARRIRKAAQAKASEKLIELAKRHLPAHLAVQASATPTEEPAQAA
ncbi:MAG: hypothetical protein KF842_06835 [Caulobacter sp.]|nr:hypothetical protein [Caulobacter sp.]